MIGERIDAVTAEVFDTKRNLGRRGPRDYRNGAQHSCTGGRPYLQGS